MKKGLVFIFGIVLILILGFVSGICGDGVCEVGEDPQNCPVDCEIRVDASNILGQFKNIAGGINFWGQEGAQNRFVDEIKPNLYRFKMILNEVTNTGGVYGNFPWEGSSITSAELDILIQNMNRARAKGGKVMLQIYGVPKWLSESDDERIITNNKPNYAKYPPQDFNVWADVVSAAIADLKLRGLVIDYYELFGEPNAGSTWYQQMMPCLDSITGEIIHSCEPNELGHTTAEVMDNFFKIYDFTVQGIQREDPNVPIGGVAIIPSANGMWWTRFLIQYIQTNNLPLDYYSWHWYGVDEALSGILSYLEPYYPLTRNNIYNGFYDRFISQGFNDAQANIMVDDVYYLYKDLETKDLQAIREPYSFISSNLRKILDEENFANSELFLTEWNVHYLRDVRHDTHYGASFITHGFIDIINSETTEQNLYSLSTYGSPDYGGFYSIFTANENTPINNNIPKASFNAFKLFSMLGDNVDRIFVTTPDIDVYSIATKNQNDISLLTTYYVMASDPNDPDYSLSKDVVLSINNILFPNYNYQVYLIDGLHSNSYLGSGPELEIIDSGIASGNFKKSLNLQIYGTVMVKLKSCIHNADLDCDDIIDLPEIIDYIDRWKNNDPDVTTSSLFDALVIWKKG